MIAGDEQKQLRKAIRRAMEYAVAEKDLDAALDVLLQYRDDSIALDLLHEFYSWLPEAREDYIRELRTVARSRGVFLLAAVTRYSGYLYLISSEGVEFHGSLEDGFIDKGLLEFFSLPGGEEFKKLCGSRENFPLYEPLQVDIDVCPACHAVTGELHELGCPVEVCPWCGGQLIRCQCRFEQLGVESMSSEEDLQRLEVLLNERGRIAYSPDQRPSFADDGPGVVFE